MSDTLQFCSHRLQKLEVENLAPSVREIGDANQQL